jgi:hypothetical protein
MQIHVAAAIRWYRLVIVALAAIVKRKFSPGFAPKASGGGDVGFDGHAGGDCGDGGGDGGGH